MAMPAVGLPYSDCSCNVSHRKAPGAISAMALMVNPVNPSVAREVVGFAPPDGVGPFVIVFLCVWFWFGLVVLD
jgi:hypothetical protein